MKNLTITTGVAAARMASACSRSDDDQGWVADRDTAVCVDKQGTRVPDGQCPKQQVAQTSGFGSPFLWYYLGRNASLPYYGDRVYGGSYAPTVGRAYAYAPAVTSMTRSAAISRGGFGSSARVVGAHS